MRAQDAVFSDARAILASAVLVVIVIVIAAVYGTRRRVSRLLILESPRK